MLGRPASVSKRPATVSGRPASSDGRKEGVGGEVDEAEGVGERRPGRALATGGSGESCAPVPVLGQGSASRGTGRATRPTPPALSTASAPTGERTAGEASGAAAVVGVAGGVVKDAAGGLMKSAASTGRMVTAAAGGVVNADASAGSSPPTPSRPPAARMAAREETAQGWPATALAPAALDARPAMPPQRAAENSAGTNVFWKQKAA